MKRVKFNCVSLELDDPINLDKAEAWTFKDAEAHLKKRYRAKYRESLSSVGNLAPGDDRYVLKFSYDNDETGIETPIDHNKTLVEIYGLAAKDGKGDALIYYEPHATGGAASFQFHKDVNEIVEQFNMDNNFPANANLLKYIDKSVRYRNGFKVKVTINPSSSDTGEVSLDELNVERILYVEPGDDYPNSPPVVHCVPAFTNDMCWHNGVLHYTTESGNTSWYNRMRKKKSSSFALYELLIELKVKYGMHFFES